MKSEKVLNKKFELFEISSIEIFLLFSTIWVLVTLFAHQPFFDLAGKQGPILRFFQEHAPSLFNVFFILTAILTAGGLIAYLFRVCLMRKLWLLGEIAFWLIITLIFINMEVYSLGTGFCALYLTSAWYAFKNASDTPC